MKKRHSHENLLCWKEIALFKLRYQEKRANENSSRAWYIYRKFIVPCVELEVSCHSEVRSNIMFSLANPQQDMFAEVEKNCWSSIKNENWKAFRSTDAYKALGDTLRAAARNLAANGELQDGTSQSQTCIVQ